MQKIWFSPSFFSSFNQKKFDPHKTRGFHRNIMTWDSKKTQFLFFPSENFEIYKAGCYCCRCCPMYLTHISISKNLTTIFISSAFCNLCSMFDHIYFFSFSISSFRLLCSRVYISFKCVYTQKSHLRSVESFKKRYNIFVYNVHICAFLKKEKMCSIENPFNL